MKLAPEKSQFLVMDRARDPVIPELRLNGTHLVPIKVVRDLGVQVSADRGEGHHAVSVAFRAMKLSNLICRTLRTRNLDIYRKAFVTLVRPTLDYASQVWSPGLVQDVNTIEHVQRAYTRRVFFKCALGRMRYPARIGLMNLGTLEERRIRSDLALVYKVLNNLVSLPEGALFRRPVRQATGGNRNHPLKIQSVVPCWDESAKNFFSNRVVAAWNCLPRAIVMAPSLSTFNRLLNNHDLRDTYVSKIR